ncbi:MAG: CapA family protein, partial [Propionibacterium sp.]|nr:CapA family protein [Propionibacterium sp.]
MHLIPHWIPLVASLGLLAGGSFASAAEEAFDLWNECAKACVLDLKDGVRSSRMSVDPAIAEDVAFAESRIRRETIAAEGWKWIGVTVDFPYGHTNDLRELEGRPVDLTDDEQATLDALDSAHVAHSGTARSAAEADRPVILTAHNGLKLGLVSGAYGLNGQSVPKDKSWAWSDARADHLLARAAAARRAGADVVIVAAHTGEEYQQEPTKEQIQLATRLTASPDVDMVYCHHSHVVQPWAKVNGKLVIYGLGNLVG